MTLQTVKIAQKYLDLGLSVIPILPPILGKIGKDKGKDLGKKPHKDFKWLPYQKCLATLEEVNQWFLDSDSRMGIITGELSNITVVDCDSEEALNKVNEVIPDGLSFPIAKTPRGGSHYYFQYEAKIGNWQGVMPGLDTRSHGGFIVVYPSGGLNGTGYRWTPGCSINEVPPPAMPEPLISFILSNKNNYIYNTNTATDVPERPPFMLNFEEGTRDQSLFHVAIKLANGGMPQEEVQHLLRLINQNICNPPMPDREVLTKVNSAFNRKNNTDRNLTEEVREWVMSTDVHFLSTDVHKDLGLSTRVHKKNVSTILSRMCEDGIIERVGNRHGNWRRIDRSFKEQAWWQDEGKPLPIKFPLGIGDFVKIYGGNLILLEGQKSQGKSAFALEFCRLNRGLFSGKILYQNVEMADSELLERFRAYGDVMPLEEWREAVTFIRQTGEWWDKILPDGLNVVDYLIEYEKSYLIAQYIWQIHQKLKSGVAFVIIQRDPMKPYGHGGRGSRDIPRAVISLIKHKVRLEDVKSFYDTAYGNPSGLCRKYKQVNWCEFRPDSDWDHEEEEKYAAFK